MSAYLYCRECDRPLPGPWDMSTENLLSYLLLDGNDGGFECKDCGRASFDYSKEAMIDELTRRIDK